MHHQTISEKIHMPSKATKSGAAARERPNRIFELTQARKWTYAEVAERVRNLAKERKDKSKLKVHEVTINRLASGAMTLTQEWMQMLGEVYAVPAVEILAAPLEKLTRIPVTFFLEGGAWAANHRWSENDCYEIMIPEDAEWRRLSLYAGELKGPASNARYPEKSVVILSKLTQTPGEIAIGRRYHVRVTRLDGTSEETIKLLSRDDATGKFWLKPESNHPEYQAWLPLDGSDGDKVELVGRVRGVFTRED